MMARRLREIALALLAVVVAGSAAAQSPAPAPPPGPASSAPMTALVEQLLDLFPKFEGEVLEVRAGVLTLGAGAKAGARQGLEVEIFRQGREIKHPRTGEILGRTEDALGLARITQAQEEFSMASVPDGAQIRPGDRFRVSSGKVNIVLLPLLGSVKDTLVETATQELVERLASTGRFKVTMGDTINVFLAQQRLTAADFLAGKGVREASERFKADNILAVHFTRAQGRPFMDVRFFSAPRPDPAVTTSFFVPPSTLRAANPGPRFSQGGPNNPPQARPRSLLQRLLGGDLEAGSYSTGENSLPLREVAKFRFPVLAMDIAVAPSDKVARMVVSDGDQIYMYRIVNQKVEPEWSQSVRTLGRVFSLQLADLDGDGILEVIGNRYAPRSGLNSFIVAAKDGKPSIVLEYVSDFLFAVDVKGEGVKQTLWTQRYHSENFFTPGQADQMILKNGKLVSDKAARVPSSFRPMGAAFSNVMGKDTRALALIDESNRLQIVNEGEELWRSSTSVGGGYQTVELVGAIFSSRTERSKFFKIEPTPLAVDLDGDGVDELIVPQNVVREGLLAVVFKGPAGFRLQSINSGFEGGITCLGAYKTEDASQPTIIASVVRFSNYLLKVGGETQIIMTVPQD
ncbi:MAG TPA: VCBS repeat-containing protein [Candidatus Deferrimicrobiaceae bacterium]|nr:VCBS repeat-containing protein [Candidatus Deferrimicrobiaceae bacterium]